MTWRVSRPTISKIINGLKQCRSVSTRKGPSSLISYQPDHAHGIDMKYSNQVSKLYGMYWMVPCSARGVASSSTTQAHQQTQQQVAAGNTVIPMASRSKGMLRNLLSKTKGEGVSAEAVEAWRKALPKNNRTMGRAKRGLYGGRHIQFGNNISEDGGNKTRRTWKPNVQEKRLFSLILDRFIRIKVTTHTLRCIDKAGCIDDYLLQMPLRKVENELALFWKLKIQQQYEKLSKMEVGFFPPEEEKKLEEAFERVKIARKASRAENREKDNPNAITEISNGTEGGIQDAMLDRKEGTESGVADEGQSLSEFQGQPT